MKMDSLFDAPRHVHVLYFEGDDLDAADTPELGVVR
jgi:hypothetical protein